MPDPALDNWLAKLAAALPADVQHRLTSTEAQLTVHAVALAALTQKIHNLEVQMSDTTDAIAELNVETDNLAGRIDAVLASIEGVDDATAAELRSVSSRLRGLAADPANPVPADPAPGDEQPVTPAPGDEGGNAPA